MDDAKTVWCGNLSDKVTEELLYELFLQAAPIVRVKIPTDREGRQSNFAFITFKHEVSVEYATQLLNGTKLFDRNITVKPRNTNQRNVHQQQNFNHPQIQSQVVLMHQQQPNFDALMRMGQNMNVMNQYQQSDYNNRGQRWDHHRDNYRERQTFREREFRGQRHDEYRGSPNHNRRHDRKYDRNRQNRHY